MGSKARLLFVVNDAGFFLSHRLPVALAAQSAGYEVHVATPYDSAVEKIEGKGFTHHAITLSRRGGNPLRELRSIRELFSLFKGLSPSIVHNVTIKPVLYGGLAARLARVPAVVSAISGLGYVFIAKGVKSSLVRWVVCRAYRLALRHPNTRIIFQNPEDFQTLTQNRLVEKNRAVLIRGSGVDLTIYVPQIGVKSEPPLILFASRMLWDKGVGGFVDAVQKLRNQGVEARFALAGDSDSGNPNAVPVEQLERWHKEGVVEWWGQRDDMPYVLAACSVFCLPSSYGEGVPKVLIEAAACGCPIVTTDWPGCREVVRSGENGLLVPVGDVGALANAIKRLIDDVNLRKEMGLKSRQIAESEFSVEKVVVQTLALYRELLD